MRLRVVLMIGIAISEVSGAQQGGPIPLCAPDQPNCVSTTSKEDLKASVNYRLVKKIPVGTEGGWDYIGIHQDGRRLYAAHGSEVVAVDLDTDTVAGHVTGLNHAHGIAVAGRIGRGFITSGGDANVRVFDLKMLATIANVPAKGSPDGVVYEPKTDRVFAFDHRGGTVTVISGSEAKVVGTIEIGGMPEFPTTDRKGTVWVNLEDKSVLVKIDAATMKVVNRWPDAPCEAPTGMDMDRANRLLFVGCGNEVMAVIEADTGKVMSTVPIGKHVDATWFDEETKLIFNANRSSVTIVRQDAKGKYAVVQTLVTEGHANTLAVDSKEHRMFATSSAYEKKDGKDVMVPGTAAVLVYTRDK